MLSRIRKFSEEREQGFTLIELLVVIIIIGILAAIAIPVFLNQRKKGVDAGLKSDLKNAATAVETWMADHPAEAVPQDGVRTPSYLTAVGPLKDFKASAGNSVGVLPGSAAGSYVLCAYNSGASVAKNESFTMVYDSTLGGIQPGTQPGSVCGAEPF